jgi:hypothetical protein
MEDRELLAAIGQVVVDAALLEYFIAVLVAAMEGRDEEWAHRELAARAGAARRALKDLVTARPDRADLGRLYQDAVAVLDDRHVIVHSVAVADLDASSAPGMGIWHPRSNTEVRITAPQVLDHAHDIRILTRRARALFLAEISDGP